jgi:hypothetical protein
VQLRLAEPVVAARGDRLILRAGTTVAGAVVLDAAPSRRHDSAEPPVAPPPEAPKVSAAARSELEHALASANGEPFRASDGRAAAELEREGRLVRVGNGFAIGRDAYDRARELVVAECEEAGTITLARTRDLLGGSRRTAQLLLERLDGDGVTLRLGDVRRLRRRRPG